MKEDLKAGDTIYWYTAKGDKFLIHECEIKDFWNGKYAVIKSNNYVRSKLDKIKFGVIQNGICLWLIERDDELAKHMFIEYGNQFIAKLQKQIDNRLKLIEIIKEF